MRIRSMEIVEGELLLVGDDGEKLHLPDGIFKNDKGSWVKVRDRRIVEVFIPPDIERASAEELAAYVSALEEQLQTVGDDAQLAQIDLQSWLQKQQQAIQTMSNVSKMLHDTAMAVIRRIG